MKYLLIVAFILCWFAAIFFFLNGKPEMSTTMSAMGVGIAAHYRIGKLHDNA